MPANHSQSSSKSPIGTRSRAWQLAGPLAFACCLLFGRSSLALVITNVSTVNITPGSFSVVWGTSPSVTPAISVFADPAGVTNLAGKVGIELFPLHTGDPTLTNSYFRRLNQAALRQKTIGMDLVHVRVSGCTPNTTYYYRVQVSTPGTNGQQTIWPPSGPLPAVTTAQENSFVTQSRQLIITLASADPSGSVILLSNTNTTSVLAAVAGDGVAPNQVFFSVSDIIDSLGKSNLLLLGNQEFTARVLGTSTNSQPHLYSLVLSNDFLIAQPNQFSSGEYYALAIGSSVLRAGTAGSLPLTLNSSGLTNLSFTLDLPTNRFSAFSLQALAPQISSASIQSISSNRLQVSIATGPGQPLQGNQSIAQFNFTTASNQSSAFVPFLPKGALASRTDGSAIGGIVVQPGRLVVVGNEPLLESSMGTNQSRNLTLYGKPWASYEIQYSTNLADLAGWAHALRVPMTNLVKTISGLDAGRPVAFYRAYEFTTLQPIIDTVAAANGRLSVVVYGTPWLAYEIDFSLGLTSPINWTLTRRVPLTNSFAFVNGLNMPGNSGFYRSRILNGDPPALEPLFGSQGRSLRVYGNPGTNYVLQYSTNLSGVVTWYPLLNYTLTNSFQTITNLGNTNSSIFYRIKR
jgi:hypothetical protein